MDRRRRAGTATGILLLVSLAGCSGSDINYSWDWSVVTDHVPTLLAGLRLTLIITVICVGAGLVLGIPVAAARMSRLKVIRYVATAYVELWRGTPVLIQLVWFYYALPIILGVQLPAVTAACMALTLNMSAFTGEAFRAGIQSISREQLESAEILGLRPLYRMRYVIIPQAIRNVLPVLISLSVSLFKDTALVSTLGVADLLYKGQTLSTLTYRPLEVLTTVGVTYFIIAFPFTQLMRLVEVRLSRHVKVSTGLQRSRRGRWLSRAVPERKTEDKDVVAELTPGGSADAR